MTRMLRRATGGNLIPILKEDDDASSDEDLKTKPHNRFEALIAESDPENRDANSAEDENTKPPTTKGVKKKSKKTKKKHSKSQSANEPYDEFDKTLEEFKKLYEDTQPCTSGGIISENSLVTLSIYKEVLQLKLSHLNEKHEIKKKFGLEIPTAFSGHDVSRHKQSKFIAEVMSYWPQLAQNSGLSMRMLGIKDDCAHFVFEHSKSYQVATNEVIQALHTGDVEVAVRLYSTLPFHVDLIMQMADIAKQSEEMERCLHLVERAVYLMEKAFHINFSSHLIKASCRLEYKYQVNRTFYSVMFQHMVLLTSRASHRTALECAKMLFSLDPHDPYAVVLILDSLALKCKEYAWLLKFIQCWMSVRSRRDMALPNLLYSMALADYHIAKKDTSLAQKATDSLSDAIAKYPHMVLHFITELPALAKRLPSSITTHAAFTSDKLSSCLKSQMYPMYVKYTGSQWERDEDVLDWLATTIKNSMADPNVHRTTIWMQHKEQREKLFATSSLSIKRHIFLADLEGVPLLINESRESSILSWDPFPPKDSIDKYVIATPQPEQRISSLTTSVINALFRSLDPSFDVTN